MRFAYRDLFKQRMENNKKQNGKQFKMEIGYFLLSIGPQKRLVQKKKNTTAFPSYLAMYFFCS